MDYYAGAYLKITVKKRMEESPYVWCGTDGHSIVWQPNSNEPRYCERCGLAQDRMPDVDSYPFRLVDDILPIQYEDVLAEIGRAEDFGTGTIYAVSNSYDSSRWQISHDLQFPTHEEIEAMKAALYKAHGDVIDLISKSPLVELVEVHCGILADEEF